MESTRPITLDVNVALSDEEKRSLTKAINQTFGHLTHALTSDEKLVCEVKHLATNLSPWAKSYKLVVQDKSYILRSVNVQKFAEMSRREIGLIKSLSDRGVAPTCRYQSEEDGVAIIDFVGEAKAWKHDPHQRDLALKSLAVAVKNIHSLPVLPRRRELTYSGLQVERVHKVQAMAAQHNNLRIYLQALEYLSYLEPYVTQNTFCHNNLHSKNTLFDGEKMYIIDWETAGAGDPYLDLAAAVLLYRFPEEIEHQFLEHYLERTPTQAELAKFYVCKVISYLRYALGLLASTNLEKVALRDLSFDNIPNFARNQTKFDVSKDADKIAYSICLLKEAFLIIKSTEFNHTLSLCPVTVLSSTSDSKLAEPDVVPATTLRAMENGTASSHNAKEKKAIQPRLTKMLRQNKPEHVKTIHTLMKSALSHSIDVKDVTIERLGGRSEQATNYKVKVGPNIYAVRLCNDEKGRNALLLESFLYQRAYGIGISPRLVAYDQRAAGFVSEFVEEDTPGWQRSLSRDRVEQLATQVRTLHGTACTLDTPQLTTTGLSQQALQVVTARSYEAKFAWIKAIHEQYQRLLPILQPEVLSHNSLSRDNILLRHGKFYFIDWENATVNDRFYDLATLVCFFRLDEEDENYLLACYLGRSPTLTEKQKFFLVKQLVLCHLALVAFAKIDDFEFVATLPPLEGHHQYFSYKDQSRHLWDLDTDFGKFTISHLLANEVFFVTKTGRFLHHFDCMIAVKAKDSLAKKTAWLQLDQASRRRVFSFSSDEELKGVVRGRIDKEWTFSAIGLLAERQQLPILSDEMMAPIEAKDRARVVEAFTQTFMPYPRPETKLSTTNKRAKPEVTFSLVRFTDGLSPWSNSLKVTVNDKPYVIRILSQDQPQHDIDREIIVMQIFSGLGVSPRIHYASRKNGVIIMDFIQAVPGWYRELDKNRDKNKIDLLAQILNKMNEFTLPRDMTFFAKNRKLENIYANVRRVCFSTGLHDPRFDLYRQTFHALDRLKPLCDRMTDRRLCHHDFNVWNVLFDGGRFHAIDWEFNQFGNNLFDLASVIIFMRPTREVEKAILESHLGRAITELDWARYYVIKQYACMHYIVMGLGICKGYDFTVTDDEMKELPTFRDFDPKKLSTKLDPHSDVGHYKLGVMFIKQLFEDIATPEFDKCVSLLTVKFPPKPTLANEQTDVQRTSQKPKKTNHYSFKLKCTLWTGLALTAGTVAYKILNRPLGPK